MGIRGFVSFVASAICASLFASPAATQKWVKDYVATNTASVSPTSVATAFSTTSWNSIDESGNLVSVSMSFNIATNDAIIIYDSNVDGMTNGTIFAKVSDVRWVNLHNDSCNMITGCVEKLYTYYGDGICTITTNVTPYVTNIVYSTTNDVYGMKYGFAVGSELFEGEDMARQSTACHAVTGGTHSICWRLTKITDAKKTELTTAATVAKKWSLLDLLFADCVAVTYGEKIYGEWIATDEAVGIGKVKKVRSYIQYAYTDASDACHYAFGEIKIGTAVYNLSDFDIFKIDSGEKVGDVIQRLSVITSDSIDEVVKANVNSTRWRLHFQNRSEYAKKKMEILKVVSDEIAALKAGSNPDPFEGEEFSDTDHDCEAFNRCSGTCGKWTCDKCQKAHVSLGDKYPATHEWLEDMLPCHNCSKCDYIPTAEGEHGGWRDYESDGYHFCACKCLSLKLDHSHGDIIEYVYGPSASWIGYNSPTICVRKEKCGRCETVVPYDSTLGGTYYAGTHLLTSYSTFSQSIDEEGVNWCVAHDKCDHGGKGCNFVFEEKGSHVKSNSAVAMDCEEIDEDDSNHNQIVPCANGFNRSTDKKKSEWKKVNSGWCGYCFTNTVPHSYDYNGIPHYGDPLFIADPDNHYRIYACLNSDGESDTEHCGHVNSNTSEERHSFVTTNVVFKNKVSHTLQKKCLECNYPKSEDEAHLTSFFYGNPTLFTHEVSNYCSKCETEYYVGTSNHVASSEKVIAWVSPYFHEPSNRCEHCKTWYKSGESERHFTILAWSPVAYTPYGKYMHVYSNLCVSAEMGGCGRPYCGGITNCTFTDHWQLINDASANDVCYCVCGNSNHVAHVWKGESDATHYCANDGGHLHGTPHTFVGDICSVCLWNKSIHGPSTNSWTEVVTTNYVKKVCDSCIGEAETFQCYAVKMFEVRTIGASSTSKFIGYSEKHCGLLNPNCGWEWDVMNDKCGCKMCQWGLDGMCMCKDMIAIDGPIDGPVGSDSDVQY